MKFTNSKCVCSPNNPAVTGSGAQLVEALRCKSEGCGLDSRWCHWFFSLS